MILEKLRNSSQSVVIKILLGGIILSFVITGIGSYIARPASNAVAKVNDEEIPEHELQRQVEQRRAQLQQQLGEYYTQLINEQYLTQMRHSILDNLIKQKLLLQKANKLGVTVSDDEIKDYIRNIPNFHQDGTFNNEIYLNILRQNGFTPELFSRYLREQLLMNTLRSALFESEFVLPKEAKLFSQLYYQNRDIHMATISLETFAKDIDVTSEEIEQYYQQNKNQFLEAEAIKLNYIKLDLTQLAHQAEVTEKDAQTYYDQHLDQYKTVEKRSASHILFEINDKNNETQAHVQAQQVMNQLSNGEDFAKLAEKHSTDKLTSKKGGDLGTLTRGDLPKALDEALFNFTQVNQTSLVKTDFGYHIIKLTQLTPAQQKTFHEVKSQIITLLQHNKAQDLFHQQQSQLSDLTYENPHTLEVAANQLGLQVITTDFFSKAQIPETLNYPKVAQIAFNPELRQENINSQVIELNENEVIVLHVIDHRPEQIKPLEQTQIEIEKLLHQKKSAEEARFFADELLTTLSAKDAKVQHLLSKAGLTFKHHPQLHRNNQKEDPKLIEAVYQMPRPTADQTSWRLIELSSGDLAIVRLNQVYEAKTKDISLKQFSEHLQAGKAAHSFDTFLTELRNQATVKIYQ